MADMAWSWVSASAPARSPRPIDPLRRKLTETQAPRPAIAGHGLRGHDGHRGAADSFGGRLQPADPGQRGDVRRHAGPRMGQPVLGPTDRSPGAPLIVFWRFSDGARRASAVDHPMPRGGGPGPAAGSG